MALLAELRAAYPQYNDLSDADFTRGMHAVYQRRTGQDVPWDAFARSVGLLTVPEAQIEPQPVVHEPELGYPYQGILHAPRQLATVESDDPRQIMAGNLNALRALRIPAAPAEPPPRSFVAPATARGALARTMAHAPGPGPRMEPAAPVSNLRNTLDLVFGSPTAAGTPQGETEALLEAAARRSARPGEPVPTGAQYARRIGAPEGVGARALRDVAAGAEMTGSGLLGFAARATGSEALRAGQIKVDEAARNLLPADPTFLDELASGAGSAASFFVPGLGIARGAQAAAVLAPRMALWLGSGAAAGMEAAVEAGNVYSQARADGKSEREAAAAADGVFWKNAALVGVTNRYGLFAEKGGQLARRALAAVVEGGQEGAQQVISNLATGHPAFEGVGTSTAIGAIIGGGLGGGPVTPRPRAEKLGEAFADSINQARSGTPADQVAARLLDPSQAQLTARRPIQTAEPAHSTTFPAPSSTFPASRPTELRPKAVSGGTTPAAEPAPAPPPAEPAQPKETPRERHFRERHVDPKHDTLLAAVAKLGGMNRAEAEAEGVDPAHFGQRGWKIYRIFTNQGRTPDDLAITLADMGWGQFVNDQGRPDGNALLAALDDALRGQPVHAQGAYQQPDAQIAEQFAEHAATHEGADTATDPFNFDPFDISNDPLPGDQLVDDEYSDDMGTFDRRILELSERLETMTEGAGEGILETAASRGWSNGETINALEEAISERQRSKEGTGSDPQAQGGGPAGALEPQAQVHPAAPEPAANPQAAENRPVASGAQGGPRDLLGAVPVARQQIADRARELAQTRGEGRDQPPVDAGPGGLFGPAQGQRDIEDVGGVKQQSGLETNAERRKRSGTEAASRSGGGAAMRIPEGPAARPASQGVDVPAAEPAGIPGERGRRTTPGSIQPAAGSTESVPPSAKPGDTGPVAMAAAAVNADAGGNYAGLVEQQIDVPEGPPPSSKERAKAIRREDVLVPFLRALKVPVYEGRVKGASRLGFYLPKHEAVRVKRKSDLEVVAHEIAHLIDDRAFGGFRRGSKRPWLVGKGAREFSAELKEVSYDANKIYEGFAEFVRLWMTQPAEAEARAPKFHAWWERWVNLPANENPYGKALRDAREGMRAWYAQHPLARAASKVGGENERLTDHILTGRTEAARQRIFDDLQGVVSMETDLTGARTGQDLGPYQTARLTRGAMSVVEGAVKFGVPVATYENGVITSIDFQGDGLEKVLKEVSPEIEDFLQWATAKSAHELKGQGRENLFTVSEIEAGLALNRGRKRDANGKTDFERAFEGYQRWNKRVVDFAVQLGAIDPKARARWRREWYLPFYRVGQQTSTKRKKGIEGNVSVWSPLTGGTGNVRDILANILTNAETLITEGLKNDARRQIVDFALKEQGGGRWITPIGREAKSVKLSQDQILARVYESLGLSRRQAEMGVNIPEELIPAVNAVKTWAAENDGFLQFWLLGQDPTPRNGEQIVAVLRGGKSYFYQVSDPLLYRSFQALSRPVAAKSVQILNKMRRFGQLTVTLTPDFMLANIWRDTLHAWALSDRGFKPVLDSMKGLTGRLRNDPDYRAYIANGGGMSSYLVDDEALRGHLHTWYRSKGINPHTVIDTPRKMLFAIETISGAFEEATRLGEFKRGVKSGLTPREAAFRAREISTDFAMRGDDARVIGFLYDTVPFLKAGVVGIDRVYRAGFKDANRGHVWMVAGLLGVFSALLRWLNDDNPLYQELEDWNKDGHWHVFVPDRWMSAEQRTALEAEGLVERGYLHLKFPKIWEIGALTSVAERATEQVIEGVKGRGVDVPAFTWHTFQIISNQMKLDWLPYGFEPIYETYVINRNRFTDRQIETPSMQRRLPGLRYSPYTPRTLRALGEATATLPRWAQVSPARANALIRGYLNTSGMYGLMLADRVFYGDELPEGSWASAPGIRRFIQRHPARTQAETTFYDWLRASRELADSVDFTVTNNRPAIAENLSERRATQERELFDDAAKTLRAFSTQRALTIEDPDLSPEQKRASILDLDRQRNAYIVELVSEVKEDRQQAKAEDAKRKRAVNE